MQESFIPTSIDSRQLLPLNRWLARLVRAEPWSSFALRAVLLYHFAAISVSSFEPDRVGSALLCRVSADLQRVCMGCTPACDRHLGVSVLKIAPSILAADFARLGEAVQAAEAGGADYVHVDVMDGHFVPNISIGLPVVAALRKITRLPLDVHLMITQPERFVAEFVEAGATILTVHVEACTHLHRAVQQMRTLGIRPGVTLNPATSLDTLREILPYVDQVLIMSVNPGFGGQSYIPTMSDKIARLRKMLTETGREIDIEVDGGIDANTAPEVAEAGANVLVAGTAIFGHKDGIAGGIRALREAVAASQRAH